MSRDGVRLTELGADEVLHDVADARGRYDIVLESTGGRALPLALARLAKRGTPIWFGQASRTPVTLDFFDFFAGPSRPSSATSTTSTPTPGSTTISRRSSG